MSILYRICRFLQNMPSILQMEFFNSARDKMIHFPEISERQNRRSEWLRQRDLTLRGWWISTEINVWVGFMATFTTWFEKSLKGLDVPKHVCSHVSYAEILWNPLKIQLPQTERKFINLTASNWNSEGYRTQPTGTIWSGKDGLVEVGSQGQ